MAVSAPSRPAARATLRGGLLLTAGGAIVAVQGVLAQLLQSWAAGPAALGGLFGLGTLLTGAGLVCAGVAARRAGHRPGWAGTASLAAGLWTVCLTGIAATDLLAAGVALHGALLLAIGLATIMER